VKYLTTTTTTRSIDVEIDVDVDRSRSRSMSMSMSIGHSRAIGGWRRASRVSRPAPFFLFFERTNE
jgi:hypothetical protein